MSETTTPAVPQSPPAASAKPEPKRSQVLDAILYPILAVFTALVIGAILILVTDKDVVNAWLHFFDDPMGAIKITVQTVATAYGAMLNGALNIGGIIKGIGAVLSGEGTQQLAVALIPLSESLTQSVPYIFAGLAVGIYSPEWIQSLFYFDPRGFIFLPRTEYFPPAVREHLGGQPNPGPRRVASGHQGDELGHRLVRRDVPRSAAGVQGPGRGGEPVPAIAHRVPGTAGGVQSSCVVCAWMHSYSTPSYNRRVPTSTGSLAIHASASAASSRYTENSAGTSSGACSVRLCDWRTMISPPL